MEWVWYSSGEEQEEGPTLLALERHTSSVRPEAMATFLYGGRECINRNRKLISIIESDAVFDREDRHHHSQTARYDRGCEKAVRLVQLCRELGLSYDDLLACNNLAVDEILPVDVHMKMFVPVLEYQTSPQQRDTWLHLAKEFRILGAYAQTELGHGSNVRALETIARYEPETQTFDLHTPSLTALKWWPGGLGKTATHAVVLARLLVRERDYGIHSFIVQLRSMVNHQPLPGISLGDIGPKLGFQSVDNGFLRLDHVRIPREQMLMGLAEVTPGGHYIKKTAEGGDKILYGAMLDVRAGLVERAALTLARALTVAIRYSAVRTQGYAPQEGKSKGPLREMQVLDYPTQQHALMPLLAWSYALQMTGHFMRDRYQAYLKDLDLSLLPEVHALSSGLKAMAATVVSDGVELCRKMCGGHGYSLFSGLPEVIGNYVAVNTFEGTTQVLEPQTARFLLRVASGAMHNKGIQLSSDLQYMKKIDELAERKCNARCARDLLEPHLQLEALECRASAVLSMAAKEVQAAVSGGSSLSEAMSASGVSLGRLSRAHCQLVLFKRFHEAIAALEDGVVAAGVEVGQAEVRVLRDLCHLLALSIMEREMGDFRTYVSDHQAVLISREVLRLCRTIRVEAVSLVDSWLLSDKLLNSALGRSDGRVYTALYSLALQSPLNQQDVSEAYFKHLVKLVNPGASRSSL